jgi:hypothetical protein
MSVLLGAILRNIDHRAILLERVAACSWTIARTDADQRFLLKSIQRMWQSLADECLHLSDGEVRVQIGRIATLHADVLTMRRPSIVRRGPRREFRQAAASDHLPVAAAVTSNP